MPATTAGVGETTTGARTRRPPAGVASGVVAGRERSDTDATILAVKPTGASDRTHLLEVSVATSAETASP